MNEIVWNAPGFALLALLLLPWLWWRWRRRPVVRSSIVGLLAAHGDALPAPGWRERLAFVPGTVSTLGVLALVLALAGPETRSVTPVAESGIDMMLLLDRSSSMRADESGRTRWDLLRETASDFVERRSGDRIGLITFARFADLICPPTLDREAALELLRPVEPAAEDDEEDATGIGAALGLGARVLATMESSAKVLVLLTDGEENLAHPSLPDEVRPLHAGQLCEDIGITVHVVAMGDPRAAATAEGREVRRIAARTGGQVFEASGATAVAGVWDRIDALERSEFERWQVDREAHHRPFLLGGLGALLAAAFLARLITPEALGR